MASPVWKLRSEGHKVCNRHHFCSVPGEHGRSTSGFLLPTPHPGQDHPAGAIASAAAFHRMMQMRRVEMRAGT